MSNWKQAPVKETAEEPSPSLDLSMDWIDQWSSFTVMGLEIPSAVLALPVALFVLYQAFASSRRAHEGRLKRPGRDGEDR